MHFEDVVADLPFPLASALQSKSFPRLWIGLLLRDIGYYRNVCALGRPNMYIRIHIYIYIYIYVYIYIYMGDVLSPPAF